jgi:hypothetical protein
LRRQNPKACFGHRHSPPLPLSFSASSPLSTLLFDVINHEDAIKQEHACDQVGRPILHSFRSFFPYCEASALHYSTCSSRCPFSISFSVCVIWIRTGV